ncbi:MAG: glycosyltransferase family 4 protein [Gaiellaceae bacterium]
MKAAYVTTYDSSDLHAWSGLGYHIGRCLELGGVTIERVGPLMRRVRPRARLRQIEAKLRGRAYALDRDPLVARAYASQVEKRLDSMACNLVFSPGTSAIAHLNSNHPVAFWADATFGAMVGFYPGFDVLSDAAIEAGYALEATALQRADVAFYASAWAARSAIDDHGADPAKVEVMPFGANMSIEHGRDDVVELVGGRASDRCRLLFVGVDWARKGGDKAVDVARVLNERGLPTEIDVVGSAPADPGTLPPYVRLHGFVDQATAGGAALLRDLYASAHVLIHPATAECFGVVFCEAAAHGVLSAAARVGGIPSAVHDGVTGSLFDVAASAEEYADYVWELLDDRGRYERAAIAAFDEYQRALSWEAQAPKVAHRLGTIV